MLHRNSRMNPLSALSLPACPSSGETTFWYCPVHLFPLMTRHMGQLDGLGVKLVHLLDGQSPRCAKTIRFWILVLVTSFDSVSHCDTESRSARSTIRTSIVSCTIPCSDKKKHISLILDMSCRVSEDLRKYIDITNWPWSRVRSSSSELWLDIAAEFRPDVDSSLSSWDLCVLDPTSLLWCRTSIAPTVIVCYSCHLSRLRLASSLSLSVTADPLGSRETNSHTKGSDLDPINFLFSTESAVQNDKKKKT